MPKSSPPLHPDLARGRGSNSNRSGRFEPVGREAVDDGWGTREDDVEPLKTTVTRDSSRTVIAWNDSPDIGFDRSLNPYRGCEHGCIYCFARPSHAYLGLSPGLDFETRLLAKPDAAALLRQELAKPGYVCAPLALGSNTDPYQPIERDWGITREVIEVLSGCDHPLAIITKSALVTRDIDLLAPMAAKGLVKVYISVTSLDRRLAREMEPRAATPTKRLAAISALAAADIPAGVLLAPMVPGLNDHELEGILAAAYEAGAREASYILLRLPLEIKELWREWLARFRPAAAAKVIGLMQSMRGGKDYDAQFGRRMRGEGPLADLLERRFKVATQRLGFNQKHLKLDCTRFRAPTAQMSLF